MKKILSQYPLAASIVLTELLGTLGIFFYTDRKSYPLLFLETKNIMWKPHGI